MEGKEELKNLAVKYYIELFSSDPESGGEFIRGKLQSINEDDKQVLGADCTNEEISRALKGMGSLKAPMSR